MFLPIYHKCNAVILSSTEPAIPPHLPRTGSFALPFAFSNMGILGGLILIVLAGAFRCAPIYIYTFQLSLLVYIYIYIYARVCVCIYAYGCVYVYMYMDV